MIQLKAILSKRGMTQKMLADSLGVTENAVSNWAKGKREPNIATIEKMTSLLDCTADDLLGIQRGAGSEPKRIPYMVELRGDVSRLQGDVNQLQGVMNGLEAQIDTITKKMKHILDLKKTIE